MSQKAQLYVLLKKNEQEEDESACSIVMSLIWDTQECGETQKVKKKNGRGERNECQRQNRMIQVFNNNNRSNEEFGIVYFDFSCQGNRQGLSELLKQSFFILVLGDA